MGRQPFYVDGVREALDSPGEFWVDAKERTLYLLMNTTQQTPAQVRLKLLSPTARSLIGIRGQDNSGPGFVGSQSIGCVLEVSDWVILPHALPFYFTGQLGRSTISSCKG